MKFYIDGPKNKGDGVYYLVTEDGEVLASHYCSNIGFAYGDLEGHRPERQKEWKERFKQYEVLAIGDDIMTSEELHRRNKVFGETDKQAISPSQQA